MFRFLLFMIWCISMIAYPEWAFAKSLEQLYQEQADIAQEKQVLQIQNKQLQTQQIQVKQDIEQAEKALVAITPQITQLQKSIQENEGKVQHQIQFVEQLTAQIVEKRVDNRLREQLIGKRLLAIQQQTSSLDWVWFVLEASSITDFIDRYSTVTQLFEIDRSLIEEQVQEVENLDALREEERSLLSQLHETERLLQSQRELLLTQKEQQQLLVQQLETKQQELSESQSHLVTRFKKQQEKEAAVLEEWQQLRHRQVNYVIADDPVKGQTNSMTSNSEKSSTIQPSCQNGKKIDYTKMDQKLNQSGALIGTGPIIRQLAHQYAIDPVLFAAITMHETGYGSSRALKKYNNPGGLMNPKTNWSTLQQFSTIEKGLDATAKTLTKLINKGGLKTISALGNTYAPIGAANDPNRLNRHWIPTVTKLVNEMGGVTSNCPKS